jgi:hypothetical protein
MAAPSANRRDKSYNVPYTEMMSVLFMPFSIDREWLLYLVAGVSRSPLPPAKAYFASYFG